MDPRPLSDVEELAAQELVKLFRIWKTAGGTDASQADFDLLTVPDLLPHVVMLNPSPIDDDMYIHYTGSAVVSTIGEEITSTRLSKWNRLYPLTVETIQKASATGEPHHVEATRIKNPELDFLKAEHLALPYEKDESGRHPIVYCPIFSSAGKKS